VSLGRWGMNLANEVSPPTMKRPWFEDRMKHSSMHKLNNSKPLTLFTTLVVMKIIGHHSRPIETGSMQ
jgi:hypothetical protein